MSIATERIREWRLDAVQFVRDVFKIEPDAWQVDALRTWSDETDPKARRVAMQACAGPGKSAVLSWFGWHFLVTQADRGHHPNAYALSITGDNLRDGLWKEFAVWRNRSEFLQSAFEWTAETIFARDHQATWWIKARTWSKTADTGAIGRTLSGLHSRYIAYFIDESGDIPPQILRSAEQGLSNCEWGKIAQAGNPTSHDGVLYDSVNSQSDKWSVFRITGDPDDEKRSPRIDAEWAREQIKTYGRENPWVMAYVLGKFPPSSLNTLLGPDEVRECLGRHLPAHVYENVQKRIGVDVARFGDDRTVLFPRQGLVASKPVVMRNARTDEIAARVAVGKHKWGSEAEFIDETGGWGGGVIDGLHRAGLSPIPVNFSGAAIDPRYFNRRSELHFLAAEWVKRGASMPIELTEIVREACAAQYWFENGKLRVEEKAQIKKRLGYSPDLWDAILTTFAHPDMPMGANAMVGAASGDYSPGRAVTDYDPFDN